MTGEGIGLADGEEEELDLFGEDSEEAERGLKNIMW